MVLFVVQKFLTIEHVPRITDFCSCIYVFGCKLRLVRLCDSDFGITPADDITNGITCAAFCFHISHISFTIIIIIIIFISSSYYVFDIERYIQISCKISVCFKFTT